MLLLVSQAGQWRNPEMLFSTFSYETTSTGDLVRGLCKLRFNPAIMLVTPDDQVEESRQEWFRNVISWSSLGSVLMKYEDIKPAVWILCWPLKLNLKTNKEGIILFDEDHGRPLTLSVRNSLCNLSSLTWERPYRASFTPAFLSNTGLTTMCFRSLT